MRWVELMTAGRRCRREMKGDRRLVGKEAERRGWVVHVVR